MRIGLYAVIFICAGWLVAAGVFACYRLIRRKY